LIKYIKSVLWRVAKRLSYIEDARCLKVKNPRGHRRPSRRHHFTRMFTVGDADLKCDYTTVHPSDKRPCNSWAVTFFGDHKKSHFR